ncbi:MAG: YdbH domain-containing protein [Pseudomonadota bacterium]
MRDTAVPLIIAKAIGIFTGHNDVKIGGATFDRKTQTLQLRDVEIAPGHVVGTLHLSRAQITIADTTLNMTLSQDNGVWVIKLDQSDYALPLAFKDTGMPAPVWPAVICKNVKANVTTPYGLVTAVANGTFAHKAWVGDIAAQSISLEYQDTIIAGLTVQANATADNNWQGDFAIATLTQGQTPLTNMRGRFTDVPGKPHVTLTGTLNTSFDFSADSIIDMAGPVLADIHILNARNDVGHIRLNADWKKPNTATMTVANLSLRTLPTLTGWEGLRADGRLSGRFVLAQSPNKDGWRITSGQLKGGQGGFIAYAPATYPGFLGGEDERLAAVREILKQLNIDDIVVTASGDLSDDMKLGLSLKGRNPDYSPRPVHLNLNFEGTLWPVAQSILRPLSLIPNITDEKDTTQ